MSNKSGMQTENKASHLHQAGDDPWKWILKQTRENRVVNLTGPEPLNQAETASLRTLLSWVAGNQNKPPEAVQSILEWYLEVGHIGKIRRTDYQRAVDFLVNLRIDEFN